MYTTERERAREGNCRAGFRMFAILFSQINVQKDSKTQTKHTVRKDKSPNDQTISTGQKFIKETKKIYSIRSQIQKMRDTLYCIIKNILFGIILSIFIAFSLICICF